MGGFFIGYTQVALPIDIAKKAYTIVSGFCGSSANAIAIRGNFCSSWFGIRDSKHVDLKGYPSNEAENSKVKSQNCGIHFAHDYFE